MEELGKRLALTCLIGLSACLNETPQRGSEISTAGAVEQALSKGARCLLRQQDPFGEIPSTVCDDRGKCRSDSTPFVTALVLSALQDLPGEAFQPLTEKAVRFLLAEQLPGGLWRYFTLRAPAGHALTPDLDDTVVVASALLARRAPVEDNREIVRNNVDSSGIYLTWILTQGRTVLDRLTPASRLKLRNNHRRSHPYTGYTNSFFQWQRLQEFLNEIDPVVNVNVLEYLREEPPAVCSYLNRVVTERIPSVYYLDDIHTFYFYGRAFRRGVACIAPSGPEIVRQVLKRQRPDGGFGNPQKTTLALNTLLDFGHRGEPVTRAARFLIQKQGADGCWEEDFLFKESAFCKDCHYWKSPGMTTAFALEALQKFKHLHP